MLPQLPWLPPTHLTCQRGGGGLAHPRGPRQQCCLELRPVTACKACKQWMGWSGLHQDRQGPFCTSRDSPHPPVGFFCAPPSDPTPWCLPQSFNHCSSLLAQLRGPCCPITPFRLVGRYLSTHNIHPPEGAGETPPTEGGVGEATTPGEGGRATTLASLTSTGSVLAAAVRPAPFPLLGTPSFTEGEEAVPPAGRMRIISNRSSSLICFVPKERACGGGKGRGGEGRGGERRGGAYTPPTLWEVTAEGRGICPIH